MFGRRCALLAAILFLGCGDKDKGPATGSGAKGTPNQNDAGAAMAPAVLPDTKSVAQDWWKNASEHCPPGTELKGKAPPEGTSVWCATEQYKRNGPRTNWHASGGKASEGWEVDSERAGPWTHWHDNGQVAQKITYVPGAGHTGYFVQFDRAGKKLGEYTLKDGTGPAKLWHQNGKVADSGPMVGGRRHGLWTRMTSEGQKHTETPWVHGKREGKTTVWKDGVRISEEHHRSGKPEGMRTRFDPKSGAPQRATMHREGKRIYEVFYQDGKVLGKEPTGNCFHDAATSKALEAAGKAPLPKKRACVHRPLAFPALTVVGSFAHDRGCRTRELLWECKVTPKVPAEKILAHAGWKRATPKNREAMALRYLKQVHLAFSGSLARKPEEARIETKDDGSITILAWVDRPSGMQPGRISDKKEYQFKSSGELVVKKLETRRFDR